MISSSSSPFSSSLCCFNSSRCTKTSSSLFSSNVRKETFAEQPDSSENLKCEEESGRGGDSIRGGEGDEEGVNSDL